MVKFDNNLVFKLILIIAFISLIRSIYYLYLVQFEDCKYKRGLFSKTIKCNDND